MKPVDALLNLEVAAELILSGPQTGTAVVEFLRSLGSHVQRWRPLYLWEYRQSDALAEPYRLIGVQQNVSAALRGVAHELSLELLGFVEWASLVDARAPHRFPAPG